LDDGNEWSKATGNRHGEVPTSKTPLHHADQGGMVGQQQNFDDAMGE
jgi:hypothetical protein